MVNVKELLESIVRAIVDMPEKMEIKESTGDSTVMFEVKVDNSDIGKIIGQGGKTANSIRTILRAVSVKAGKNVMVEIIEDGKEKREFQPRQPRSTSHRRDDNGYNNNDNRNNNDNGNRKFGGNGTRNSRFNNNSRY